MRPEPGTPPPGEAPPRTLLWLGHPHCHDVAHVGGKAASLSRLATRFQVPPGFCLPTTAYADWRAAACCDTLQMLSLLSNRIAAAYAELARTCGVPEPSVAVRSSAVDEDGSQASAAGVYETCLNVVGISAVAEAVVRCWASGESERARAYRRRHGQALDGFRMAVLVQQFIPSEVSAVVFSANPVTGNRDEVMINVSWGLGESIVGGRISPDTYVVRKGDLAVVQRQVADKRRMTVPTPGGTSEVDVPGALRTRPALDDAQILAIVHLALALEATMGWPADIECAGYRGQLYLLQCRPITTLDPL